MYGDNIKMTKMTVNRIKHKEVSDHNLFKTKSDIILSQKDRDRVLVQHLPALTLPFSTTMQNHVMIASSHA